MHRLKENIKVENEQPQNENVKDDILLESKIAKTLAIMKGEMM